MSNTAEVVVIGGGIIGCATSYYLAKRGVSVICLEGSDHIGNGGSSRNGGGVRQSGRDPRELVPHGRPRKSPDDDAGVLQDRTQAGRAFYHR